MPEVLQVIGNRKEASWRRGASCVLNREELFVGVWQMSGSINFNNLRKTVRYLKKNGIRQTYYAARERMEEESGAAYEYEAPDQAVLWQQRKECQSLSEEERIKFSILVPAYETEERYLRAMLDSLLGQSYEYFEVILADASDTDQVERIVKQYEDKRILYKRLRQNAGIAANTNQALMYATGDYAGLLDHDDMLSLDALYEMFSSIRKARKEEIELQMLYSDEDKCDGTGTKYFQVHRKYKFNLDLIMSNNYICHFLVMKRQLMQELGLRSICDGAQDYDLVLRAVNVMMGKDKKRTTRQELPIAHVPRVLYHWRSHQQSTAQNPSSKEYAYDAGKKAVEDFLRARGIRGRVVHTRHLGFYRVEYQPDLLSNCPDTAVVGGRILNEKNIITGGIYTADGVPLYKGLHKEYSGYMHRASLQQEAQAVDVRCMKVSAQAEEVLEELLGLPYLRHPRTGRFDWRDCLKEDVDFLDLSLRFCEMIRSRGWRIVYDPEMTEKIRKNIK